MKRTINHVCGSCGATGRVFIGLHKEERPCLECGGTGYQSVEMSLDHEEADRWRTQAKRTSLNKFTFLLSGLTGGVCVYWYARNLSYEMMAAYFFAAAVPSFIFFKLPVIRDLVQFFYNILRLGLGLVFLLGVVGGTVYLMILARQHGGW